MFIYAIATVALLQSSAETPIPNNSPAIDQQIAPEKHNNDIHVWGNADVSDYLISSGPDGRLFNVQIHARLLDVFTAYQAGLVEAGPQEGFERMRRHARSLTMSEYLRIPPDRRRILLEEEIATESLRHLFRRQSLMTGEMIEFINDNYGEGRLTNKQLMDELALIHRQLIGPEDPFVAPPLPAEAVLLTFPIPQMDSQSTYWTYDRSAGSMTIVVSEDDSVAASEALVTDSPPQTTLTMRGWAIGSLHNSTPTMAVVGGREIPVATDHVMGFGEVQQSGRASGLRPGTVSQGRTARVFRYTFSIDPESARALSGALELQVAGSARPWRDDQRTLCVSTIHTDRQPVTRVRSCFLTGVLETYRVVDKRDGTVIHEWDAR